MGTSKSKDKLQHVAQILAELLDNDNDGCPDDAKAFNFLTAGWKTMGRILKPVFLIYHKDEVSSHLGKDWQLILEKAGYYAAQTMGNWEVNPCGTAKLFTSNIFTCY